MQMFLFHTGKLVSPVMWFHRRVEESLAKSSSLGAVLGDGSFELRILFR